MHSSSGVSRLDVGVVRVATPLRRHDCGPSICMRPMPCIPGCPHPLLLRNRSRSKDTTSVVIRVALYLRSSHNRVTRIVLDDLGRNV